MRQFRIRYTSSPRKRKQDVTQGNTPGTRVKTGVTQHEKTMFIPEQIASGFHISSLSDENSCVGI